MKVVCLIRETLTACGRRFTTECSTIIYYSKEIT